MIADVIPLYRQMVNPYESPVESGVLPDQLTRDECPVCGVAITRWSIVNAAWSYRCIECNQKLRVVLPRWAVASVLLSLVIVSLLFFALDGFRISDGYLLGLLFNLVLIPVTIWMRSRFGRIRASGRRQ